MFDGPVGEALDVGIFYLHQGRRLRVNHFAKSGANGHGLLYVEISGSDFGFSRRNHNIPHDFGHVVKRAVGGRGQRRKF